MKKVILSFLLIVFSISLKAQIVEFRLYNIDSQETNISKILLYDLYYNETVDIYPDYNYTDGNHTIPVQIFFNQEYYKTYELEVNLNDGSKYTYSSSGNFIKYKDTCGSYYLEIFDYTEVVELDMNSSRFVDFGDYYECGTDINESITIESNVSLYGNINVNGDVILNENGILNLSGNVNISGGIIYNGGSINYSDDINLTIGKTAPSKAYNINGYFEYNPTRVILTWDHNGSDNEGFNILRNRVEINNTLESNATMFIDYDINTTKKYTYNVVADNIYGTTQSDDINITVPLPLTLKLINLGDLNLTDVYVVGKGENNESFYIPSFKNIAIGSTNETATVPVYNNDNNFSIIISVDGNDSLYYYNFFDKKLYQSNTIAGLVNEINETNNVFEINLSKNNIVFENTAPIFLSQDYNFSIGENENISFEINATDGENDQLSFSISGPDSDYFEINTTGILKFKNAPDYEQIKDTDQNNIYDLNISVSDGEYTISNQYFIEITNIDEAPVLSIESVDDKIEDFEDFNITLNVSDEENDSLNLDIFSNSMVDLVINNNILTVKSKPNIYGTVSIDINASQQNNQDLYDLKNISFDIIPQNDAPQFATDLTDLTMYEDNGTTSYELNITDIEGDELNVTIESNNTDILKVFSSFDMNTKLQQSSWSDIPLDFNLTTLPNAYGLVQVKISVNDGDKNSTSYFDINIQPVNDAPIFENTNDINISGIKTETFCNIASDIDNDLLTILSQSSNDNIVSTDVVDQCIVLTTFRTGSITLNITVSDGEFNNTVEFIVNVIDDQNSTIDQLNVLSLNSGWNFISFPTSSVICDSSIQQTLSVVCNQEFDLNSMFDDDKIDYIFKYNNGWEYWDRLGSDKNGTFSRFSAISSNEGFVVKANSSKDILMPTTKLNEIDNFISIYKKGWYLVGVNEDKTVHQINELILKQSKILIYLWVYRNNQWYLYAPLNDDTINWPDDKKVETIGKYESFWILIN